MELRECPFCGGAAQLIETVEPVDYGEAHFMVACGDCGVSTDWSYAKSIAVATWNRRAIDRYELTDKGRELLGGGE